MASARFLNVDAEPFRLEGVSLRNQLKQSVPAIVQTPEGFLGLLRVRGQAQLITPSGNTFRIGLDELRDAIAAPAEASLRGELEGMLKRCGVPESRRERATKELLRERLATRNMGSLWRLQLPVSSGFNAQMSAAGLPWKLGIFVACHAVQYSLWIGSWFLMGRAALSGRLDTNLLSAWALLLFCTIPFRMLSVWAQGQAALGIGGLLKRRLGRPCACQLDRTGHSPGKT